MPPRGSDWVAFLRALVILQRLIQSPASKDELIAAVINFVGDDAYPLKESARNAAFKHDREHLRGRLKADFVFDQAERIYLLTDPGPFGRLELSTDSLKGLGVLERDFGNGLGERVHIRTLLDELIPRLSPETRRLLERQPEALIMGIRQFVDQAPLPVHVWETVKKAVETRRKLSFNYLSPRYKDQQPVYFEIMSVQLKYQEGHWYLRGWILERKPHELPSHIPEYVRFRITYILDDGKLRAWPTVFPERFRTPPSYLVHYKLAPEIGRGEISHHFQEMQISRHPDGSAELRGFTDDIWEAGRLLLAYGEGCVVIGGTELRREMERRVEGMAKNYGFWSEGL